MKEIQLNETLKNLQAIVDWFDEQQEVDVELGLQKIKEGAVLIQSSKERLKVIENEFEEVKKSLL